MEKPWILLPFLGFNLYALGGRRKTTDQQGHIPAAFLGRMIYSFDEFKVDSTAFEVWRAEQRVDVQPQVIELLIMLISNRDRFISKEEIFGQIWKNRIVSDTTLSSRIKSARKVLGDDGTRQKYIRTVHGRGFRFVADVEVSDPALAGPVEKPPLQAARPVTRYAKSGDVHIAYQQFGTGPADLVFAPGFVSHIENYWDDPHFANWLSALGRFARVAIFDKRGTGLSDPVGELPGLEVRMDDVRAVMDAVGLDDAFIMGISEGGSLASMFAATYPERCRGLILYGAFARFSSWFPTKEALLELFRYIETAWGSGDSVAAFAPSMADNPAFKTWWGKFERLGATPGSAIALMRMNSQIDITDILPAIQVPTLVIHRTSDVTVDVDAGRLLSKHIPNATYVELPGVDHLPWVGNTSEVTSAIADFLKRDTSVMVPDTVLKTVLCAEMIGPGDPSASSEDSDNRDLMEAAGEAFRHRILRFRGQEILPRGAYRLATFDGPARAVHCANDLISSLKKFDISTRIGLYVGEVWLAENDAHGAAVDAAMELGQVAGSNEIVASATVKDLVPGAGISFEDLGPRSLRASAQPIQTYRATFL